MSADRVEAHDGPMFTSYEMTKALVAERQGTLRQEARVRRLTRRERTARRSQAQLHRETPAA